MFFLFKLLNLKLYDFFVIFILFIFVLNFDLVFFWFVEKCLLLEFFLEFFLLDIWVWFSCFKLDCILFVDVMEFVLLFKFDILFENILVRCFVFVYKVFLWLVFLLLRFFDFMLRFLFDFFLLKKFSNCLIFVCLFSFEFEIILEVVVSDCLVLNGMVRCIFIFLEWICMWLFFFFLICFV